MPEQEKKQPKHVIEVNDQQLPFHEYKVTKGKVTGRVYLALDKDIDSEEGFELLMSAYGRKTLWDNIIDPKYRQACSNWSKQALDSETGVFNLEDFTDMVKRCSMRSEKIAVIREKLIALTHKLTEAYGAKDAGRVEQLMEQLHQLQNDLDAKTRKGGDDNDDDDESGEESESETPPAKPAGIPGQIR